MSKRFKFIAATYLIAAVVVLSVLCAIEYSRLRDYRRAAAYSSRAAFEMTVLAVDRMGAALAKSLYATDGGMCGSLCGEIYARASAAEAAMASLPFETQELEKLSAFLNKTGDYAYSLSSTVAEQGFSAQEQEQLYALSTEAEAFAGELRQLQTDLNNGLLLLDSMEAELQNVGVEDGETLSAALLSYEAGLTESHISYDGQYSDKEEQTESGSYDEEQERELAAAVAGVEPRELKEEYNYSGTEGRRCYSAGSLSIFVSSRGIEALGQSRLVEEANITVEEARELSAQFLQQLGLESMELVSYTDSGTVAGFNYSAVQDGAICLDSSVQVSVALDDGSIYAYNGENYSAETVEVSWNVTETEAMVQLPASLSCQSSRKVILTSAGGRNIPCFEFTCLNNAGAVVRIYVNADTGKQYRIEV